MTSRQQIQGDYNDLIQSPEITSTTEPRNCPNHFLLYPERARGRRSYRTNPYLSYHSRLLNRRVFRSMDVLQNIENILAEQDDNVAEETKISTRTSLIYLAIIFLSSICILGLVYNRFPELTDEEKVHIKLPWNLDDAKNLGFVLNKYKENHFFQVYFGVSITYVFLQTFAIPGSIFLSVLSGFLFPFFPALFLVCTCSALGASLCFLISQLAGRRLIQKYFPERANSWAQAVHKHRHNLLNYVIFLRVTPFLPNWFINLTAPVIGVPLWPFAFGTFLGVAPPSFIALQAGQTLHNMSAADSALSWTSITLLIVFGCFSLVPIYFKDRLKRKFE